MPFKYEVTNNFIDIYLGVLFCNFDFDNYLYFLFFRYTWEEEIRLRMPDIPVTGIYVLSKTNEQFIDPAVVITSYDLMNRSKEMLLKFKFGVIILVSSIIY